jgi:hypothetical protein
LNASQERAIQVANLLSRCGRHALEGSEQLSIDLILESRTHAVRCAWNHFQRRSLDNFGREKTRYRDRCDLIVIAVQNKSWYIEPLEVFRGISLRKSLNALVDGFVPLEANNSDRRLHYTYARLLMATTPEDRENIAYHLQRAFTDGDSNYEAQLLYGRQRFPNGRFEESRTAFGRLAGARVAPEIKNRLLHPILDRRLEWRTLPVVKILERLEMAWLRI